MGQYIPVSTPADEMYKQNCALERIIAFLGEKYKEDHHGFRVRTQTDEKAGIDFIDKECGKRFKKTINNLINSKKKATVFNADYRCWKIHKYKAEKFFRILYNVLKKKGASKEIWALFDDLYDDISRDFPIEKRGSHILPYPYRAALNQIKNDSRYSQTEKKSIARIVHTFPAYDSLYH